MCADFTLHRTGEAAKFLLCLNVIVSTARSVVEKTFIQLVSFGNLLHFHLAKDNLTMPYSWLHSTTRHPISVLYF